MPIKQKLTLGLGLVIASGPALADSYKIKQGDTVERVAHHLQIPLKTLLALNGIGLSDTLRPGHFLTIPGHHESKLASKPASGGYIVRNGDMDWTIAKKHGISVPELRKLNPGVDWDALQIGAHLNVPGARIQAATAVPSVKAGGTYALQSGDNDWIVAKKFSTTPTVIRQLNPGLDWDTVRPGRSVHVPAIQVASQPKLSSRYALVSGDHVSIRKGPGVDHTLVTLVQSGTRVVVLDRDHDWYKLRFPYGTVGWVRGDFLTATSEPASHSVAKAHPRPAVVQPRSEERYAEETSDSSEGNPRKGGVERVLGTARSMRGVRYRWGSASRSATDCSGFTTQAFRSIGIKLPRTSSEQSNSGTYVPRENLRAGDLVFFKTVRGTRVSHVGIYIGNNKFIHASSGGGKVIETSLSDPYYNNRYVTARRLVKNPIDPKDITRALPKVERESEDRSDDPPIQTPDDAPSTPDGSENK